MNRYNVFRYISYIIEILIFYYLELSLFNVINIDEGKFIFTISVASSIAMFENKNVAMFFGIFTGFLMDASLGQFFGFNAVIFAGLSFIIGMLTTELIKTNMLTALMANIVYIVAVFGLQFLFFYVFKGYNHIFYTFYHHYLNLILCSILPSPIIYLFNKLIFTAIQPKSE